MDEWFRATVTLVPDGIAVATQIITERKRAEEALRESRRQLQSILDTSRDLIYRLNLKTGQFDYFSPAGETILGYSAEEFMDISPIGQLTLIHPEDVERVRSTLEKLNTSGHGQIEYRFKTKSGEYRWLLADLMVIIDADGQPLYRDGLVRDITERKRAEEALRESDQRYSSLFANKINGMAHCRVITDEQGKPIDHVILAVNEAYERIVGIKKADIEGRLASEIFPDIKNYALDFIGIYGRIALEGGEIKFEQDLKTTNKYLSVYAYSPKHGEFTVIFTDITEQKQNEELLRESEARFKTLNETSPVGIGVSSEEGVFIYVNPTYESILGYNPGELIGEPCTSVYWDPEERKSWVGALKEKGVIRDFECRLKKKDGTLVWISINTSPILFEGKQAIIGTIQDITERKRAEEALREWNATLESKVAERTAQVETERRRLYDVLETLPALIWLLTPDYHVAFANRAACEKFGEVRGRLCYDACFGLSTPCEFCETYKVLTTGQPVRWEAHPLDGSVVDVCDFPFTDVDGSPMILEMGIDITERKRADEKIREQAMLLDNAQEAVEVRSLEHRLIYWNKGAQRLYGWTKEEAIGKDPVEFLYKDKEELPQLIEAKRIVLEKGEWVGELHQITKDNREVIVESHWTLINGSEGKLKSILVVNIDITEKKKFESQLLRAQRMESIGTLAGGIAHDLNNMLTPMMMSLHLLKEKFKDEQSQKLLTTLEKNSQRSADLIKQVLSFSRGVEGERNPLAAKYLITEIEKIAKETFPRNIEIRTDVPKDLFMISGDATQLHQVIMNLCVNARDAMPDGGILNISAENFLIDENYVWMHTEAKVGSYVAISVSDTGIGIPPKILDRIFEPFFTTKEFGKGTGLGLSTALAIVKSHGGLINVQSEVGEGTTFWVYLPATLAEMQKGEEEQLELFIGHGELVLVAEDEDSVREVTISTLKENGYKMLTANDGADAVALYAQNKDKIKVVLMDMMMPVMDGYASIKAIRKINPQVKVIVVSGLAEKDKLAKIESTCAQAILPKPYTAEKLLKTVHEVLSAK